MTFFAIEGKVVLRHTLFCGFASLQLACATSLADDQYRTYSGSWAAKYATRNYNVTYGAGNPFPNYDNQELGGNCTNFASQALIAGFLGTNTPSTVFNQRGDFDIDRDCYFKGECPLAWFFADPGDKGPAWAGANKLYEYAQFNKPNFEGLHFEYVTSDTLTEFMDYKKVRLGDLIFADWEHDGIVDHTMIVTGIETWRPGYNEIRVTYQSVNKTNQGLGDINEKFQQQALFYVYRPVDYDPHKGMGGSADCDQANCNGSPPASKPTNFGAVLSIIEYLQSD